MCGGAVHRARSCQSRWEDTGISQTEMILTSVPDDTNSGAHTIGYCERARALQRAARISACSAWSGAIMRSSRCRYRAYLEGLPPCRAREACS